MRAIAHRSLEEPVATSKQQEREAREARDRLKRYNARQAVHTHQIKRRRRDNLFAVGAVVVVAALAAATQIFYFTGGPGMPTPAPSSSASSTPQAGSNVGDVPSTDVAEARTWTGQLDLNSDVKLGIELDGAAAPQAVAGFITDVNDGYLIDKTCHRLVDDTDFGLIQCGSADGAGGSDPSYSYGPLENAPADNIYPAGTIAIARTSDNAYGNGHQFFIVFADTTIPADSAGGYTVIGKVTSGLDDLKSKIVSGGLTAVSSEHDGTPNIPTTITKVTIQ
jgi:peptidyl-prolyl cis-trans isomerase B (cyclophilin B)